MIPVVPSRSVHSKFVVLAVALLTIVACDRDTRTTAGGGVTVAARNAARDSVIADSIARVRQDSINRTLPGYVIDSILPVEEQLRRFRAAIGGERVRALVGGARSRDELVRRFARAVETSDTATLFRLAVSPREFADLIYPESPNVRPPYQQDPALVWRTIQNPSQSGLRRLVRRAGGIPMPLAGYRCNDAPAIVGRNRFWRDCELRIRGPNGDTSLHRLFGTIVEREGQFKFLGYRNEF